MSIEETIIKAMHDQIDDMTKYLQKVDGDELLKILITRKNGMIIMYLQEAIQSLQKAANTLEKAIDMLKE